MSQGIVPRKELITKTKRKNSKDSESAEKQCCNRYHIDEYDEYYADYLKLAKENKKKDRKINYLEKEIVNLKHKIDEMQTTIKSINFDKARLKVKTVTTTQTTPINDDKSLERKNEERGSRENLKGKPKNKYLTMESFMSSNFDSDKSILSIMLTKCKSKYTQTYEAKRRSTFIEPVEEQPEPTSSLQVPNDGMQEAGEMIFIDEEVEKPENTRATFMPHKGSDLDLFVEKQNSMDFFLMNKKLKRKRANSYTRKSNLAKNELKLHNEEILKILEENKKLEEQMLQLNSDPTLSKENEKLKQELSNVKSKLSEKEEKIINEKDEKINELERTLFERQDKYQGLMKAFEEMRHKLNGDSNQENDLSKMIAEKEEELEKINYQNASYRAQLIELKISMTKARDASRFSVNEDENVIKVLNAESKLEEAQEQIMHQRAKIKEQDSIIETLLAQSKYYKEKYNED